jgi:hypothetical protein
MFHACVKRFDVTGNLKILAKFLASKRCLGPSWCQLWAGSAGGKAGWFRLIQ